MWDKVAVARTEHPCIKNCNKQHQAIRPESCPTQSRTVRLRETSDNRIPGKPHKQTHTQAPTDDRDLLLATFATFRKLDLAIDNVLVVPGEHADLHRFVPLHEANIRHLDWQSRFPSLSYSVLKLWLRLAEPPFPDVTSELKVLWRCCTSDRHRVAMLRGAPAEHDRAMRQREVCKTRTSPCTNRS